MKKWLSVCLAALLCWTASAGEIASVADLVAFAAAANSGGDLSPWQNDRGETILTADLDLGKTRQSIRIEHFKGVFDGKGHALLNWKTDRGLFGIVAQGSLVKNLVIDRSCSMKVSDEGDDLLCAGFIADVNHGTLEHCENYGSITHRSARSQHDNYIGGICGLNKYVILRCINGGKISSSGRAALPLPDPSPRIFLGGILGGCFNRSLPGAFVAYCENRAEIDYTGAFPTSHVGGIAGYNLYVKTKFCINRGSVNAESQDPWQDGDHLCQLMVGGVCGMAKGDIMCCDNFGAVTSRGDAYSLTAGICGSAHAALTIGNCNNFAPVLSTSSLQAEVGGIVGQIGRPVVVACCCNKGSVRFEGVSVDRLSTAAGIAGNVYAKKTATYAAVIRNCRNEGEIYCASAENSRNSVRGIHTAGIVGCINGNESVTADIRGCVNLGQVHAPTGRVAGIAGFATCCRIEENENQGRISGDGALLGGIVAAFSNGPLRLCTNRGAVAGGPRSLAGGIAASTWSGDGVSLERCRNCGPITGRFGLTGAILGTGRNEADRIEGCGVGGRVGTSGQTDEQAQAVSPENFGAFILGRNVTQNKIASDPQNCYFWDGN